MASPQLNKVSMFVETTYGTANTSTDGIAYRTADDGGWTPIMENTEISETYSGRQGIPGGDVRTNRKGWEGSFSRALRTHGEERWLRDAVGTHNTVTAASAPQTTPPTFAKSFTTDAEGPSDSYTIAVDSYTLDDPSDKMTNIVYAGVMSKGWGLSASEGGDPVMISQDFVARDMSDSESAAATVAAYPAATSGDVASFGWRDLDVKVGAPDSVPTVSADELTSFSYTQENNLQMRWPAPGYPLMKKPFMGQGGSSSSVSLEFNYSSTGDTTFYDRFINGTFLALQLELVRDPYRFTMYLPRVWLVNVTRPFSLEGVTTMPVEGTVLWPTGGTKVAVTYTTEGATNA